MGVTSEELQKWDNISRKMKVVFNDDQVISQFEGYDKLKVLGCCTSLKLIRNLIGILIGESIRT
jgi:trehalose/maltose hydrolase-like predicted phosphorylase